MAWWRRDPSLFTRSPLHRYAQRVLRDNEAALRTRCFSRTPLKSAEHEGQGERKRPANMSSLEWMQLQHYDMWRKRLQEDPYRTLFGASNDMLNGKGLMEWDWMYKSFPKWMSIDIHVDDKPQEKFQDKSKYPQRVETRDESSNAMPKARQPLVTDRYSRRAIFERDESAGIVSPSDLRRPREYSHVKVVGSGYSGSRTSATTGAIPSAEEPNNSAFQVASTSREPFDSRTALGDEVTAPQVAGTEIHTEELQHKEFNGAAEGTSARHTPPTQEFLDKLRSEDSKSYTTTIEDRSWRQTALQRRAAPESIKNPQAQPSIPSTLIVEEASPAPLSTVKASHPLPAPVSHQPTSPPIEVKAQADLPRTRSSTDVLKQLPEDDIDFLSAADIRASMRLKRSGKPSDEQRQAVRQGLEEAFIAGQDPPHLDPILAAGIVNDQYVRRVERGMRTAQAAEEANATESLEESNSQTLAESSIDRMKKWLEDTGTSFAKQFWQDPTEEADVTKTKLFFDKIDNYLKKGQAATRHITEDLQKDIPASKPLLKRLRSDEQLLDSAIHQLRQRSHNGTNQGLSPMKTRAMESLKTRFYLTNTELEKAYEELCRFAGPDAASNATGSFKRRLTAASKVLHKNSQLLRMLVWSLQTRLEDPNLDRGMLSNYKVVADNLLSLRDTQMTLLRLVERAMSMYNVVPNATEKLDTIQTEHLAVHVNCEDPFVRARLAADAHLINEIKASKNIKEAINEEKIALDPKPSASTILNEPSPLAHSLFRPFGPAIDKLGSKEIQEQIREDERRKLSDAKLVDQVKQAYEDTYGRITTERPQINPLFKESESSETVKSIQVLKDDPEAPPSTSQDAAPETTSKPPTSYFSDYQPPSFKSTGWGDPEKQCSQLAEDAQKDIAAFGGAASAMKAEATSNTEQLEPATEPTSTATSAQSIESLPTHYTIVVRDPQTDALSITTSTSGPPRDTSPAVPLHQALSELDSPAKFIPYITAGLEVVSAKKYILVLRDAIDSTASTRPFETIRTSPANAPEQPDFSREIINPIDGTTRLSPTGYVGPEESAEQLEKEFQDRRQAASKINAKDNTQEESREQGQKTKRRGAGVAKTAIWVAGMCYVAGVIGEIATGGV